MTSRPHSAPQRAVRVRLDLLPTKSTAEVIEAFVAVARARGAAFDRGDIRTVNRRMDQLVVIKDLLMTRSEADLAAFAELLTASDPVVREMAGAFLLQTMPEPAAAALNPEVLPYGWLRADAGMTLWVWRRRNAVPPPQ